MSYGDTIQAIAQRYLGNMNNWIELAEFNNLRYPYIVDTPQEKMQNPNHLVAVGDTILVRVSNDEQTTLIADLKRMPEFDQEELYALALGKDLDITPLPKDIGSPGWDSEILELKGTPKGGLAMVRGVENLKQALFIRLTTPLGSYVGHPNFGSKLYTYLGKKNTEENIKLINIEIERTLRMDGRVTHVEMHQSVIKNKVYAVSFKISSIALEDAFDFVIAAQDEGLVLLNNFNELAS